MRFKCKKKRKMIIILITIVIIIVATFFILQNNGFFDRYEYSEYDERVNTYGLSQLYENSSNEPNQRVTKIEAIKIVICATNNTLNLSSLVNNYNGENEVEKILNYAYSTGIVKKEELELNNCYKNADIIDIITYVSRAKYYILKKNYGSIDSISLIDYNTYKEEEKIYIMDLVSDGVLDNNRYRLNAYRTLKKSFCNKIIVKYIEKYGLLSILGKEIITNQEELPSNYNEYPYIVSDVDKEIYEQAYIVEQDNDFHNPADFYKYRKDYYISTISNAEDYYNTILNISYDNISYDDMYTKLSELVAGEVNKEELKKYVEYVKNNNITISGNAIAQVPCIYNDGTSCRIRMKLEFNINSSTTRENLLYMDSFYGGNKIYDKDSYIIYIDAKMGYVLGSKQVLNSQHDIYSMLLDISKNELSVK